MVVVRCWDVKGGVTDDRDCSSSDSGSSGGGSGQKGIVTFSDGDSVSFYGS